MTPRQGGRRAIAAAVMLLCLTPGDRARAQDRCPSAEACLARSFDRDWDRYLDVIQQTAADRKAAAELLGRARRLNRPDLVAQIQARQAVIEERWRFATAIGAALTSPRFESYLTARRDAASRAHAAAAEQARRETDLYRRLVRGSLGQAREGVIRDIAGYEREAVALRETFNRDAMISSVNAVKEAAEVVTESWTAIGAVLTKHGFSEGAAVTGTVPYVAALNAQIAAGHAAVEAVHGGLSVQEALRRDQHLEALFEATRAASSGALRMAELLAKMPDSPAKRAAMREAFGPVAARAAVYANVLAVGLDTTLTLSAVRRLQESEARQARVEASDAAWRARVDASARIAADAALREARASRQIENQRRVGAAYRRALDEAGR
jgi:hypothetical protein